MTDKNAAQKPRLPKFYGQSAHVIGTIVASIAIGFGTYSTLDESHAATVAHPQLEADSMSHLRDMADVITQQEQRILFIANVVDKAKDNIGKQPGDWSQQFAAIQTEYDKITVERAAQNERLEKYRTELLFNANLSEEKADTVYTELYYKAGANQMHAINNYLAPLTDALKYRDECKVQFDAANKTPETGAALTKKIVACGRDTDAAADSHEITQGLIAGGLTAAFGLIAPLGAMIRRRKPKVDKTTGQVTINVIRK